MGKIDIEKKRSFIINFVYALIIAALAYILLKYVLPLLGPFVIAFLIAYALRGPIIFLRKRLHIKYKLCALLTVALFFIAVGLLLSFIGIKAVSGIESLVNILPGIYTNQMEPAITEIFNRIEFAALEKDVSLYNFLISLEGQVIDSLGNLVTSLSMGIVGAVSSLAASLPGLFVKLVLLLISTFFIAMDYDKMRDFCLRQMSEKSRDIFLQIKEYVVGTLFVCIRSYALIMSITFVELSIGLTIIGIKHSVLIAACIAIFDILPVLGTGGIMLPWTAITALRGNYPLALSLLLVYVVITIVRNILEPKIVGGQLGLHPVVTLASMFAGVQLLGAIGLFGFPIGFSLLRHLDEAGTIHLFKKAGSTDPVGPAGSSVTE